MKKWTIESTWRVHFTELFDHLVVRVNVNDLATKELLKGNWYFYTIVEWLERDALLSLMLCPEDNRL